ncbi:zona pellucida-binding protein 1 isoform X6 [Erythrolamprus reginae]|uniref:zona pellucida-binding protein 1 isoform X6 n=1 Tax=Erythrolamprus reginae TaxID=121349 RepID=UPI00396C8053
MRRRGLWKKRDFFSAYWNFYVSWVALALSLLQGFSFVHSSTRINHHATKVVGSTNLPVKVYVRQHHNSPHILCLTNHLRNSELIDPIFEWHGPSGDLVTGNESVTISPTGTLVFQHFKSYMSGIYTCSLVFKPTTEQEEKSYLIKYVIYVSSLEAVKGKSVCQNSVCDVTRRLRKAKDLIGKFFGHQVEFIGKRTAPLPEIYYIEGTLQMVWINRCFPGYGINSLLHPDCPNCCVVCSPGTFNPHEGTHCLQCNRSLAYGAKHCY